MNCQCEGVSIRVRAPNRAYSEPVGIHPEWPGSPLAALSFRTQRKGLMKYSAKNITCIAGSLLIAGLMAASAADTTTGNTDNAKLSSKGASFVKEASAGNQAEIALAELAQTKSQSAEVKDLAKMLQQDHQQAQAKLQTIAQAHGLTLDATLRPRRSVGLGANWKN